MKFQYFRYFLNPIDQMSLFPSEKDKNTVLKEILEGKIEYKKGVSDIVYLSHKIEDNILWGKLGRKSVIKRSIPSENDFNEEIEEHYPNCNILFNFDNNAESGQRIAFEYDSRVFKEPEKQIKTLEENINESLFSNGYAISIQPIKDEKVFWDLVKKHQGNIEKLTFSFAVPNLFNLENELNEDLKKSGETYGITNTTIEFENKAGYLKIPENDNFIKQSAEYTSKGGGEYKLRVKGQKSEISNKKSTKTRNFDEILLETDDKETFLESIKLIFK